MEDKKRGQCLLLGLDNLPIFSLYNYKQRTEGKVARRQNRRKDRSQTEQGEEAFDGSLSMLTTANVQ